MRTEADTQEQEDERLERALLAYAHREATRCGTEWFAEEFRRRDEEERRLNDAEARRCRYPSELAADRAPGPAFPSGPVDSAVEERVVGPDQGELDLKEPIAIRHPHVPRAVASEPARGSRRARRSKHEVTPEPVWAITAAEAARMSPAGRRLYGLEELPDRDRH